MSTRYNKLPANFSFNSKIDPKSGIGRLVIEAVQESTFLLSLTWEGGTGSGWRRTCLNFYDLNGGGVWLSREECCVSGETFFLQAWLSLYKCQFSVRKFLKTLFFFFSVACATRWKERIQKWVNTADVHLHFFYSLNLRPFGHYVTGWQ